MIRRILFSLLAVFILSTAFSAPDDVQPVKFKIEKTIATSKGVFTASDIQNSINLWYQRFYDYRLCSTDACKNLAIAKTNGVRNPVGFGLTDTQLTSEVTDYFNAKYAYPPTCVGYVVVCLIEYYRCMDRCGSIWCDYGCSLGVDGCMTANGCGGFPMPAY